MSFILVDDSQKGNLCCSKSVDLERGCANQCIGCYGTKTSMMGADKYFNNVISKDYDENKFKNSCRLTVRKSNSFARLGKHSDCGHGHLHEVLKSVLEIASEEKLRLIFVSKSLKYDQEVAKLLRDGHHTLHISLGMITQAPSDKERLKVAEQYHENKVHTCIRVVEDVTKPVPAQYAEFNEDYVILTPMRYTSKEVAEQYSADLSKYKWENGYYRPAQIHESWKRFKNVCGEINGELKCCSCMVVV